MSYNFTNRRFDNKDAIKSNEMIGDNGIQISNVCFENEQSDLGSDTYSCGK